ncbi:MAG: CPBP family intramembrane metalloprotease [Prevotellaceae bacterium]|jgi:membrane protease YdiL (CAAX protease family)|nr:CPBP family intramembrane metalloprotease [Prevotellaceae bacterium]
MFDNNNLQTFPKKTFYPDLKQSGFLVLLFLPAMLLAAFLGEILKSININADIINLTTYVFSLGTIVAIAFICKKQVGDKPALRYSKKVSVWVYILAIPAIIGLGGLVDIIGVMILPEMPESLKESLEQAMHPNLPTILTAVVAAPIFEEIICRGIICEGLIKNISPRAGILWSAFIFALIHLNPWQGISAFAIGCFLGWIYWKAHSILPCIFIHFINNGLAVYLYYYYGKLGYDLDADISEIYQVSEIFMIVIYAAIFLASFLLLSKILKSK